VLLSGIYKSISQYRLIDQYQSTNINQSINQSINQYPLIDQYQSMNVKQSINQY